MTSKTKSMAFLGLCTTLALILAYVETLMPPLFAAVPGIKVGLPNIIIIFLLYRKNAMSAIAVSFLRMTLVTMLFGNVMMFLYSLAGALLSMLTMILLRRFNIVSMVGVSVAGAVMHNVGQTLMAMLLLDTTELAYYLVVLLITGTIAGIFIGLCGSILVKRYPKRLI